MASIEIIYVLINLTKVIDIEVTKTDNESTISKVMKLVEEATNNKSKSEKFITKCSDLLNADLWDTDMYDEIGLLRDAIFEEAFGVDGMDIINWWVFEDVDHVITKDGKEYYLNSIKDLYNYVTTCLNK